MAWPNTFIVGAPRCGTTSVKNYLSQNDDVDFFSIEPHFFGSDIDFAPKRMSVELYSSYLSDKKIRGDKSTWYLFSKKAAWEIAHFYSDPRIIIQIRNPVDMVISLHNFFVYKVNRETITDFEKAWREVPNRKRGINIPEYARFPEHYYYTDIPLYTEQIKRYVDAFGWDKIFLIVFDDLINKPQTVYKSLCDFLDIKPNESVDFVPHNDGGKYNVSTNIKIEVRNHFLSEVQKLSKYINRDLEHWLEIGGS